MINLKPNKASIWVSTSGSDSGNGTSSSPFRTIQKAINTAEPGTSIYVKAGTYNENVRVSGKTNPELKYTTPENSIALISVDGIGAAKIRGRDEARKSTIELLSVHDFVVNGFEIIGNTGGGHDQGPIKITGGSTIYNDSGNVHIINNLITGTGTDAIKAINTEELVVAGNRFRGVFAEQITDFIAVMDSVIQNNHVSGSSDSGITFKGGSTGALVTGNHIAFKSTDGKGPGVKIGGEGLSRTLAETPLELRGFEAKNITVTRNVIEGSGAYGIMLQGAHGAVISENYIYNAGVYAFRASLAKSAYGTSDNSNNRIANNILDPGLKLFDIGQGAKTGSTVTGTQTGTLADVDFAYGMSRVGSSGATTPPPPPPVEEDIGTGTRLEVKAGGTGTDAAAPQFTILVDGMSLGNRTVSNPVNTFNASDDSLYDTFVFNLKAAPKSKVEIVYTNDGRSDGVNRDLVIDYIKIGETAYESEASGYFAPRFPKPELEGPTERLYVNGTLYFDDF